MFKGLIDDFKTSTGNSLRMAVLATLAGFAGLVALCFLCAAAFVVVMQRYGAVEACLAIAAIFVVLAVILAIIYSVKQKRVRKRAARMAARAAAHSPLLDPGMLATGIQIARSLGLKKLIPLLALAGVAAGYMAVRSSSDNGDDKNDDAES